MSSGEKCVFCGLETLEKVRPFTSETRAKCHTVLQYRRSKPIARKSRCTYVDVELPNETSNDGYHAQCYKRFTAIKIPADSGVPGEEMCNVLVTSTTNEVVGTSTDE